MVNRKQFWENLYRRAEEALEEARGILDANNGPVRPENHHFLEEHFYAARLALKAHNLKQFGERMGALDRMLRQFYGVGLTTMPPPEPDDLQSQYAIPRKPTGDGDLGAMEVEPEEQDE